MKPICCFIGYFFVTFFLTNQSLAATSSNKSRVNRKSSSKGSRGNRESLKYGIDLQLLGSAVSPTSGNGITAGYYYDPDIILEFDFSRGHANILFFELFANTMSLRMKRFWGNSFYTNVGIGSREIGGKTRIGTIFGDSSADVEIGATSLVAEIAIGNKWQWKNFGMGCDWFGTMVPLLKLSEKDTSEHLDTLDQEERDKRKNDLASLAKVRTYQILRFYLGFSF